MRFTPYSAAALLFIVLLVLLVPVLRIGFGASWFWATSPLWIAIILLLIGIVVLFSVILKDGFTIS